MQMRQGLSRRTTPSVPSHCGFPLVCDTQSDDFEVGMLFPCTTEAMFNALPNGAPDLQRVVLDPSASTACNMKRSELSRTALRSK